ncbi:MAG: DUF2156 domain-containing protein [Pirellulales bacterium]
MRLPTGSEHYTSQTEMPADAFVLLERYAYDLGQTYDSYLVTEVDREYFWCAGRRGVVGFIRRGRNAYVVGGLIASPENREALLAAFLDFAASRKLVVSFLNIGRNDLALFRRHNCQVSKFGEEPLIDLEKTTWNGKAYEWLRRQENFCIRQGLQFHEIAHDPGDAVYRDQIVPELEEISRVHVAGTLHGKELEFLEGRFRPLALGRRRLFVAVRQARTEAFVVCNPCLAGGMWAFEMYRRRPDATRGVIPYAMLQAMRKLKTEGVTYASLSLIPFVRSDIAMRGDSRLIHSAAWFWWRYLNWIFDMRGIYHYKSRFRPDFREMYLAAWPRVTVMSLLGLAAVWRVFSVNPFRLANHVWRKWQKSSRETLARPEWRPKRLLRELRPRARCNEETCQPFNVPPPELPSELT